VIVPGPRPVLPLKLPVVEIGPCPKTVFVANTPRDIRRAAGSRPNHLNRIENVRENAAIGAGGGIQHTRPLGGSVIGRNRARARANRSGG
jgi:hypothetical protein